MRINSIRPIEGMKLAQEAYYKDLAFYLSNKGEFEERNCPGCESNMRLSNFINHQGLFFDRCSSCWAIYMNPVPTAKLIKELYEKSEVYKIWSEVIYPKSEAKRFENLVLPRVDFLNAAFGESLNHKTIVEIGSGTGDFLREVYSRYPSSKLIAIEPNPDMWKSYTASSFTLSKEDYQTALPNLRGVNAICAFEVIEHLKDPSQLFALARESLVVGGKLICSTPNAASIEIMFTQDNSNTVDLEHISLLSPSAIHNLAVKNGFRVEFLSTPGVFDIELISKSNILLNLLRKINKTIPLRLQEFITQSGFSSHMKFCLSRN